MSVFMEEEMASKLQLWDENFRRSTVTVNIEKFMVNQTEIGINYIVSQVDDTFHS